MDTVVTIQVVSSLSVEEADDVLNDAMSVFRDVERVCSRFDAESELMQLTKRPREWVPVSPILFQSIRFALNVAEMTDGQFDPTVGRQLERLGFNRNYLTGRLTENVAADIGASFRDILLDEESQAIQLRRPIVIDLGAVAKGLAIDMAAKRLKGRVHIDGFAINAGGDVYAGGMNEAGKPWRIGIRDPHKPDALLCRLTVTDAAVCTSGNYERQSPLQTQTHHILVPGTGQSQNAVASCTVIAPYAMMADALSTAAFVLGAEAGLDFLTSCDVEGLMVTTTRDEVMTRQMGRYIDG